MDLTQPVVKADVEFDFRRKSLKIAFLVFAACQDSFDRRKNGDGSFLKCLYMKEIDDRDIDDCNPDNACGAN